jgi:hypothetical protein
MCSSMCLELISPVIKNVDEIISRPDYFVYITTHADYVVNNVDGRLVCADPIKPTPRGC